MKIDKAWLDLDVAGGESTVVLVLGRGESPVRETTCDWSLRAWAGPNLGPLIDAERARGGDVWLVAIRQGHAGELDGDEAVIAYGPAWRRADVEEAAWQPHTKHLLADAGHVRVDVRTDGSDTKRYRVVAEIATEVYSELAATRVAANLWFAGRGLRNAASLMAWLQQPEEERRALLEYLRRQVHPMLRTTSDAAADLLEALGNTPGEKT